MKWARLGLPYWRDEAACRSRSILLSAFACAQDRNSIPGFDPTPRIGVLVPKGPPDYALLVDALEHSEHVHDGPSDFQTGTISGTPVVMIIQPAAGEVLRALGAVVMAHDFNLRAMLYPGASGGHLPKGEMDERFAITPIKPDNLHRILNVPASRLTEILCHREQRYVGAQLTLSHDRKQIILERNEVSGELAGKYVELYDFADRPMELRWKGVSLPYRVFSKDQRVSHTAIVESKRLGHALTLVKAQQDLKRETKVLTNSEKTATRSGRVRSMDRATLKPRPRQKRWRCWSDGKHGRQDVKAVLSPTLPPAPGKPPKSGGSHIPTARRRGRNKSR